MKNNVKISEDLNNIDSSCTNDESEDWKSYVSHNDQDSDVSFKSDNDEEVDATEIEEEGWIECIKKEFQWSYEKDGRMRKQDTATWLKKIKWRLTMRIATSSSERWLLKTTEWNPDLSSKYRSHRSNGRSTKRWEDDINEFHKKVDEKTENLIRSSIQINKKWINTVKDRKRCTLLEEKLTTNSEGRHENNTRTRRTNSHNIPTRNINEVKLSDEESADITWRKWKED